jgi:hypothetical protein
MKPHVLLRSGFLAVVLTSCGSGLQPDEMAFTAGRRATGADPGIVARIPPHPWQLTHLAPCEATVLIPGPVEDWELEPAQTTDGVSVHTRKWRYEAPDATFLATCDRRDSGRWGPDWARHAALGIATQFELIGTDVAAVHESPVKLGTYVGLDIQATSRGEGSRLHALFITSDTMAIQLVVRHPTRDPGWHSATKPQGSSPGSAGVAVEV